MARRPAPVSTDDDGTTPKSTGSGDRPTATSGAGSEAETAAKRVADRTGAIIFDPGDIEGKRGSPDTEPGTDTDGGSDDSGTSRKRGRGRPRGSRSSKKASPLDINAIEMLLFSTHAMLAGITKVPEIALTQDEAKQIAVATGNVARHYDLRQTQKQMDWAALLVSLGTIYGGKVFLAYNRVRAENASNVNTPRQAPPTDVGVGGAAPKRPNTNGAVRPTIIDIPGVGQTQVPEGFRP